MDIVIEAQTNYCCFLLKKRTERSNAIFVGQLSTNASLHWILLVKISFVEACFYASRSESISSHSSSV